MTTTLKTCFKCGIDKPRSEYYAHKQMGDGLLGKCKVCARSDVRANRADKIEYYRAYDRARASEPHRVEARKAYDQTPRGREKQRQGSGAWAKRNPEKRAAQIALGNAVRHGKIAKPSVCPVCHQGTESRRMQAHHHDYSKPLDVQWMCVSCHAAHHKAERDALRPDILI